MSTILFYLILAFMLNTLGLSLHRTHLMSILICIESLMLVLYLMVSVLASMNNSPTLIMIPIMLLAMSACEASMGLALLVATSRTHGTDHMKNLNLLKC